MNSLSDYDEYLDFCYKAASDTNTFNSFRQNAAYRKILEHVTREQGQQYLDILIKKYQWPQKVFMPETVGSPDLFEYDLNGQTAKFNPSTLRYIKVLSDIVSQNDISSNDVVEIGVGYGGQCRIIHEYCRPKSYTLIDLFQPLLLARRFLESFPINGVLIYQTMNEYKPKEIDLVISNYAISELRREIQEVYVNKILKWAKHGYITFNDINPPHFRSMKKEEIAEMVNGTIEAEEPLTHPGNCIIRW